MNTSNSTTKLYKESGTSRCARTSWSMAQALGASPPVHETFLPVWPLTLLPVCPSLLHQRTQNWTQCSACGLTRTPRTFPALLLPPAGGECPRPVPPQGAALCLTAGDSCQPLSPAAQDPLHSTVTLWCLSHSSQLHVTCKPAEGALCLLSQILHEDVPPTNQHLSFRRTSGWF